MATQQGKHHFGLWYCSLNTALNKEISRAPLMSPGSQWACQAFRRVLTFHWYPDGNKPVRHKFVNQKEARICAFPLLPFPRHTPPVTVLLITDFSKEKEASVTLFHGLGCKQACPWCQLRVWGTERFESKISTDPLSHTLKTHCAYTVINVQLTWLRFIKGHKETNTSCVIKI